MGGKFSWHRRGSPLFFAGVTHLVLGGRAHPCDCWQLCHATIMCQFKNDDNYEDGDPDPADPCNC